MNQLNILLSLLILPLILTSYPITAQPSSKTILKIRIIDGATGTTTPAMVCITGIDDRLVRIPPTGKSIQAPSDTRSFYQGISYQKDKNWIGPVRKMNGKGDNNDRSYVYELLPSIPYWKEPVMYQTSGDFTIEMPLGKFRIALEHGNEYIPVTEEFEISGMEKLISKTYPMQRWIDLPAMGWYSGDVHVHHPTNLPEYRDFLIEYAKAADVHLVNTLEMGHHLGTDFHQIGFGKAHRTQVDDYWLVSGQEDPRSVYGHIIGLNTQKMVRDTTTYNYYDIVFNKLHQQPGAVVGFAHFSWNGCDLPRGFPWYITTEAIDFVELLQFSKINTIDYYDYLNLGFRITAAAGSDIPWGSTLGEVRTFVYTGDYFSADTWFQGLKAGHTFVSNGPALLFSLDGQIPGSEIIKKNGSTVRIDLSAISHPKIGVIEKVAIYNNDGLVIEASNPKSLDTLQIMMNHPILKSQWMAAVVYCTNGAVAHTTPFYIVVDGLPTWNPDKAPEIILKQLAAIQKIEAELRSDPPVDKGIIQRMNSARSFYHKLNQNISKQ